MEEQNPPILEIQGDYNSVKARHLKLMFEKCDSTVTWGCKSDTEITDWLKRKFIVILENTSRFDNGNYLEDANFESGKIVKESRVKWVGINSQLRQEMANDIRITSVELQDWKVINLNDLTVKNETIFAPVYKSMRPYEFPDTVHVSISYEMDLTKHFISREVYTWLDWLGDIGGLSGMLYPLGSVIMMLLVGNGLYHLLLKAVFKEENNDVVNGLDES